MFDHRKIIEGQRQRELCELLGNTGRSGNSKRGDARARLYQQSIGMPVIAAFKLHDVFAFCVSPGQPNRRHGRFRARADEADFLHVRKRAQHQFGQIRFRRGGSSKASTIAGRRHNRIQDIGLGVPQNQRSPRSDVVDQFVVVGVPDVRPLAAHDESGISSHRAKRPHRRIHTARNHAFRPQLQAARLFSFTPWGGRHRILSTWRKWRN